MPILKYNDASSINTQNYCFNILCTHKRGLVRKMQIQKTSEDEFFQVGGPESRS